MNRAVWLTMMTAGCLFDPHGDGGQSGTETPDMCVEDSRDDVTDLGTPAGGLDFSAQDALDVMIGTWQGSGDLADTSTPVTATLARTSAPVQIVTTHLEEGTTQCEACEGGPAMVCGNFYEIPVRLDVTAGTALSVGGDALVQARAAGQFDARFELDASEVGGTVTPPAWENPEFWDRTVLSTGFSAWGDGTNQLDATWWAINDDPVQDVDTADGTVTVEPSGQSAPLLLAHDLAR